MLNINILNNLIKGITDQIPLVHSYYTVSPYDSWNVKECKYGSVSFVVTRVNTRQSTTTYDATIYYADRLLENNANRDSVYSDAATVIQTIVGALNQADDYLEVSYPVGITLFEQDFADRLAGGYANLSISAKGMGECFEDDFTVPEIIATSAYFTKEQITELFPLRTQLATVAFSGSFSDLKDVPNLATVETVNGLAEAVVQSTSSLAAELNQKVSAGYFDSWADGIEAAIEDAPTGQEFNSVLNALDNLGVQIDDLPTRQQFDTLRTDITDQLDTVRHDLDNKVGSAYFENWKDGIEAAIEDAPTGQEFNSVLNALDNLGVQIDDLPTKQDYNQVVNDVNDVKTDLETRPTRQDFNNLFEATESATGNLAVEIEKKFDTLYNAVETVTGNLAVQLDKKVDDAYFETVKDNIEAQLANSVSKQSFDNLYEAVETVTGQLAAEINNKLTAAVFEEWKKSTDIENRVTQAQYDELFEAVKTTTGNLAAEIKSKLDITLFEAFKNAIQKEINSKADNQDFNNLTQVVIDSTTFLTAALDAKLDDNYFDSWADGIEAELSERVTRQAFDNFRENVYDKEEIDTLLAPYLTKLNEFLNSDETKEIIIEHIKPIVEEYLSTALDYYTKSEMDEILANLRLDEYYTKEETYNKTEIDAKLENLDLTEYYTKEETYNKTEIDTKLENLHLEDYYTKTEIDDKFTAIDDILNNVLYNY